MATAQEVLKTAAGEIGYSRWNDPLSGTKYGRWFAKKTGSSYFGTNGVPYCAMFVSYILDQCGQKVAGFPTASCPTGLSGAKKAGIKITDKKKAKAGDIIFFDWDGNGNPDHVGFVEKNCGSYVQTIEGNTSAGSSGSQSNGGGVYRRTRAWSTVLAVVRPQYSGSTSSGTTGDGKLEIDGLWGEATTLALQKLLKAPYKDGVVSRQDSAHKSRLKACTSGWEFVKGGGKTGSQTIELVQKKVGVKVDGYMGPKTINALIKYYQKQSGADVLDGKLDYPSITVKSMQRAINAGKF